MVYWMAGSVVAVMGEKILRENKIPPFRGGMVVFWDRFGGKRFIYNASSG